MSKPILIWAWDDAPEFLKQRSKNGGDEDGIAVLPAPYTEDTIPWWLERIWNDDESPQTETLADGSVLVIWSHA